MQQPKSPSAPVAALARQDGASLRPNTTFGTATDITLAELSIESFFPADAETAAAVGAFAGRPST
jgi:hypothetical protein